MLLRGLGVGFDLFMGWDGMEVNGNERDWGMGYTTWRRNTGKGTKGGVWLTDYYCCFCGMHSVVVAMSVSMQEKKRERERAAQR